VTLRRVVRGGAKAALVLLLVLGVVALGAVAACLTRERSLPIVEEPATPAVAKSAEAKALVQGLEGYARPEDQTYLTLPEWFIVYSADEYAAYLREHPPGGFPYFRSVAQFWDTYCHVYGAIRGRYPFNTGYHVAIFILGASYSLEYGLKGAYEHTIGRLTEWLSSPDTEEDRLAADVARQYGEFIHAIPFYDFPYATHLGRLWSETSWVGPHLLRKLERRAFLTAEYGIQAAYAWVIRKATASAYGTETGTIGLWVEGPPPSILERDPRIRVVREVDATSRIIEIPRYEPFREILTRFAEEKVPIVEIAGNDEILVTAITDRAWKADVAPAQVLFGMGILTEPERQRIALRVPVPALEIVLPKLRQSRATIEHLYDY
jgi:hypothetical protein